MSDEELEQIIHKARMFKELRRAKERVKRLERQLRGEPVQPEDSPYVPEFLRVQVGAVYADGAGSDMPLLRNEKRTHAMTVANSAGSSVPINRTPASPRRIPLIESSHVRSRQLVDLLHEPCL
jgi:hypothetical protein